MENRIKLKLNEGNPVIGIWNVIPSPVVCEIIGLSGFDFQILDMEHGIFDISSLDACIRACEIAGSSPIVRIPGILPHIAQSALDLGAHGIIVPQVLGYEDALKAVSITKYSPEGIRGYNPFVRAANYSNPTTNEFGKLTNSFGLSSIIIENKKSYEEIKKILTIKELDLIYLGVYDMAVALGCKGNVNAPEVVHFLENSVYEIKKSGKYIGMMVKSQQEIEYALQLGANVLVYGVDTFLIQKTAANVMIQFNEEISRFAERS